MARRNRRSAATIGRPPRVRDDPGSSRTSAPTEDERRYDSVMDRAAQPGGLLVGVLFAIIIGAGWLAPKYVADPSAVQGAWRPVVGGGLAAVVFLAFSTLNLTAYCLLLARRSEATRKFIAAVANRAAVGAILGTLLGLRLATLIKGPGRSDGVTFLGFEGNLSNTITLVTLVLIATAWPYSWRPVKEAFGTMATGPLSAQRKRVQTIFGFLLIVGTHKLGLGVATSIYFGIAG